MATKEQIDALKRNWTSDPCWDIEDTEGFEDHYDDLKAYRIGIELQARQMRRDAINRKAAKLRCSPELAEYIMSLEQRISRMDGER